MDVDDPVPNSILPNVDSPPISTNGLSDIETVTYGGQEFRIRRPPGPQPTCTIALPVHNNGVFDVDYVDIYVMKRPSLVELCKKNNLGVVGKKVKLQEKLVGFSEDMIRWNLRSHRGVRDGKISKVHTKTEAINTSMKKPKKIKGLALRRHAMMGLNLDGSSNVQVQRLKDMHPVEEQEKLLQWADQYYAAHPYIPPEEVSRMLKAERDAKMDSPALIKQYMHSTHEQITGLTSMVGSVFNILSHGLPHPGFYAVPFCIANFIHPYNIPDVFIFFNFGAIAPDVCISFNFGADAPNAFISFNFGVKTFNTFVNVGTSFNFSTDAFNALVVDVATDDFNAFVFLDVGANDFNGFVFNIDTSPITLLAPPSVENDVMMTNTSSFSSTLRDNNITIADISPSALPSMVRKAHCSVEEKSFEIILANQKLLRFKYHDIPEPSLQLSFAHDIARLDRIWDDKGPHWDPMDCATVSSINGVPVALCYWQQIYKGKKDQHWDGIKGMWSEWRSITPEEFWSEFQTNAGEQMNWTAILERLREL
ncbi:MAG: hypothetical protein NXY57DRAFT_1042647 [Lentinula lateritia]|nr:MAG: hypothetical protein NXY57DRAFT_1042647 [Lentinula lateritia]